MTYVLTFSFKSCDGTAVDPGDPVRMRYHSRFDTSEWQVSRSFWLKVGCDLSGVTFP